MSPKNKIKLNFLRKKLDNLDIRLLNIVKERTEIIKKVLALKAYKSEIIDKKRISTILKKNNYLLCGGSFFSTKTSCFLVEGLYFFAFSLIFAFSPPAGFFT